jgi:hypothetical protein
MLPDGTPIHPDKPLRTFRAVVALLAGLASLVYRVRLAASGGPDRVHKDGPCRDRTCDLGIKSPLLYQLS